LSFCDALISLPYTEERNQWQGGSYYTYKAGAEEKKKYKNKHQPLQQQI